MSIFDRRKPLKSLRRWAEKYFVKKHEERIDFVDTTKNPPGFIEDDFGPGGRVDEDGGVSDSALSSQISDDDGDTSVQCEQYADEDKIRFNTVEKERFRIEGNDTNGGALYIKEGSGTTAPSTPSSGEGVVYEKNDGKLYFKNDGGTEYDLTSGAGGGMTSFDITGDSGSAQTVTDGNTVDIEGGTGINTVAGATDKITVNCDLEGTELKSTGETGGSKFLREDGDGTCSWQTPSGGGSMSSFTLTGDSGSNQTITDGNTVDIEGGTGISTVVGATDKVTINCDVTGGGTVQGTDGTYDIQAANEGSVTGNNRGEYSVDLQTDRNNASEVASGIASALIGGTDNTASGNYSSCVGGNNNEALAGNSSVLGGATNDINSGATNSAIVNGSHNDISANGDYSAVVAGRYNESNANYSVVSGYKGKSKRTGETVIGGDAGSVFGTGEAQCGQAIWNGRTTNNSATELFLMGDGSSRFTLDTDSVVTLEIWASVADESAPSTYNAGYSFIGTVVNDSGTTAIGGAGSITKTSNPTAAFALGSGDLNVTADNTNDSIKVTATGITGRNLRWVVSMRYTEVVV